MENVMDKQIELDGVIIPFCKEGGDKYKNGKFIITNKVGEINYNRYGSEMTIVKYNNSCDITVKFDNGYIKNCTYAQFKNGTKSPYCKTICGIGVVGLENIYPNIDLEYKKSYDKWRGMITRCYNEKSLAKAPTYRGCTVSEEWLFYPNFKKWFDENWYEIEGQRMHLDKDILHKGNKIYSSDTCIIVPERINTMFTHCDANRGDLPIGVNYLKKEGKYRAQCNSENHGNVNLGSFDNPVDAFYKYKPYKESSIRIVAQEYKDRIPKELYNAMINWKVEISD